MHEDTEASSESTDAESVTESPEITHSWAVSICFWCTLLIASVIYGVVALAPKFAVWNSVRHEYRQNAEQLVSLDGEVEYLERVASALETDPEFVQRLAGQNGLLQPDDGSEMIPVSGNLLFGYEDPASTRQSTVPDDPPFDRLATTLATNVRLRGGLLVFSATLTIFSFTFLNDAGEKLVHTTGRLLRSAAAFPMRRYTTPRPSSTDKAEPEVAEPDEAAAKKKTTPPL